MRPFVEDFRLENGQYPDTGGAVQNAAIDAAIDWSNETVGVKYDYYLDSNAAAATYSVYVVSRITSDSDGNPIWARCENNFQTCCTSLDAGAGVGLAGASAACP